VAKPVVDGLERKLGERAQLLRLDVNSDLGKQAAYRFGVRAVPTLILVDGSSQVILTQAGVVRPAEVLEEVDKLVLNEENTN
jgi:thiol-disulfide isomerase/thioredoxin